MKSEHIARWSGRKSANLSLSEQKDQILSLLDARAVMEFYGIQFNRIGFAHCPFHGEKTASLSIKNDHYKCFGCHAYGNVIDFVMNRYGLTFREALVKLDSDFNLGITGQALSLSRGADIKRQKAKHDRLKADHEEFRNLYRNRGDLFRYLRWAIVRHAPTDPDQDSADWHPLYTIAGHNLVTLEQWLDDCIDIYSDIQLYAQLKTEGRVPYWESHL